MKDNCCKLKHKMLWPLKMNIFLIMLSHIYMILSLQLVDLTLLINNNGNSNNNNNSILDQRAIFPFVLLPFLIAFKRDKTNGIIKWKFCFKFKWSELSP